MRRKCRLIFLIVMVLIFQSHIVFAVPAFVQKKNSSSQNVSSVAATFDSTPISGNLLIAIVSNRVSSIPTTPTGWSVAISTTNVSPGQVIYYKIAGASEPTTVTVTDYATTDQRLGIQIFEYSGVDTLDQTNQSSGNGSSLSTGSITTTVADELLIAGVVTLSSTNFSAWSNSFTEQHDFGVGGFGTQITAGGADRIVTTTGSYSTTATASVSGNWRAQIASFSVAGSINISGTCKQVDQSTDCTDIGAIHVAVNGTLQAETQPTAAGTWSITGVTIPASGDVITVFIADALNPNLAVAVTKYDGTGNMTGIELIAEHLTLGSDDNQTLTNVDLSQYDNSVSGDEDLFYEVDVNNDLVVDIDGILNEELYIKVGNTYRPDSGNSGNVTTHDIEINGTLTADGNTFTISGNWVNSGIFTANTSTVVLNGSNQTITGSSTFNNFSKTESSNNSTDSILTFDNTATQTISGLLTLDGFDADDRINLVSDSPGTQWSLVLSASASKAIDFIDVTDSDASDSDANQKPVNPTNALDGGNNLDWFLSLQLVKVFFQGDNCLASSDADADCNGGVTSLSVPTGVIYTFVIYVSNTSAFAVTDIRFQDDIDDVAADYFEFQINTFAAGQGLQWATTGSGTSNKAQIKSALNTGTALSNAFDGSTGTNEYCGIDTGGSPDQLICGGDASSPNNDSVDVAAGDTFAIMFNIIKRD